MNPSALIVALCVAAGTFYLGFEFGSWSGARRERMAIVSSLDRAARAAVPRVRVIECKKGWWDPHDCIVGVVTNAGDTAASEVRIRFAISRPDGVTLDPATVTLRDLDPHTARHFRAIPESEGWSDFRVAEITVEP